MKTILFLVLLTNGLFGFSQFHLVAGVNGNIPYKGSLDIAHDVGAGLFFEVKYRLNEKIDVGVLYSRNSFFGIDSENYFGISSVNPLLATITHIISEGEIVPYVGVGVGLYRVNSLFDLHSSSSDPFLESNEFGFSPKIGLYHEIFDMGLAYNITNRAQYFQLYLGARLNIN